MCADEDGSSRWVGSSNVGGYNAVRVMDRDWGVGVSIGEVDDPCTATARCIAVESTSEECPSQPLKVQHQ